LLPFQAQFCPLSLRSVLTPAEPRFSFRLAYSYCFALAYLLPFCNIMI
jgi:hypothetical protein